VTAREQGYERELDHLRFALQRAFDRTAQIGKLLGTLGLEREGGRRHCRA